MLFIRKVYVMSLSVIFGLISFLLVADQGKYHLAGSEGPIEAQVGSDVVLPCNVKPPVNVRDAVVEWMFNSSKTVHLFRNKADDPKAQHESYRNRTSLNHKMIEHGNVSLKLTNVTKNDAGNYTCIVPRLPGHDKPEERNIILVVVDGEENENPDSISGGDDAGVIGGVVVACVVGSLITFCVVRRRRVKQIIPCRNNKSRNEEVRNDAEMEMEQLRNPRGNGNQGDEAEAEPLQNQEEPN